MVDEKNIEKSLDIGITGMTCASCSARVEKSLKKISGVEEVNVNLATEKARLVYDPSLVEESAFYTAVKDAGYGAEPIAEDAGSAAGGRESTKRETYEKKLLRDFIISAILSFPLLMAMFAGIFSISSLMFLHNPLLQFILATPVQLFIGFRFYKNSLASIKSRVFGMDFLVAMGTSAAYLLSVYNGFFKTGAEGMHLYFEASAMVITLVVLGRYMEAKAKGKTSEAIKKLMNLKPDEAIVIRGNSEKTIKADQVMRGDICRVKPGTRIPTDGTIKEGHSTVDESMITGESVPVEKGPGEKVIGGTINSFGSFIFEAEKVGKDTVLSGIIRIVEEAQGSKAPIQKLADQVAGIFVPVVLGVAVVTFGGWYLFSGDINSAVISAVSVLVIACPCALGLATPTAIMVGTGKGAEMGILIKNGESLEQAGKIDTIILDKTGTVTEGKPQVTEIIALGEEEESSVLALAGRIEASSEHPLARAIVEEASKKNPNVSDPSSSKGHDLENTTSELSEAVTDFAALPGKGVRCRVEGKEVLLGTKSLIVESGISTEGIQTLLSELENQGKTAMVLARGGSLIGVIAVADREKPSSREAVRNLMEMGHQVYMITGDNEGTARAIAEKVGIRNVIAGVLPEGKQKEVEKLKSLGKRVAMVGDGINDAPALVSADLGIALGSGTDIAIESSDITLIKGDLAGVEEAIRLSRATIKKIKQNLFWAFFYNTIGIPLAAFGLLSPIIAGAAMSFSSVSVVSNSLTLKRYKVRGSKKSRKKGGENMNHITITIEGMTCNHCKMAVEKAIESVEGVSDVAVDLEKGTAEVAIHEKENTGGAIKEQIFQAVKDAGYTPAS